MAGACPLWAGVLSTERPFCSLCVPFVFPFCSLCVPFVFPFCSLSVPFVFPLCSLCVPFLFPTPTYNQIKSKRQARYRRLHVASQRVPLCNPATLRVDTDALRFFALLVHQKQSH